MLFISWLAYDGWNCHIGCCAMFVRSLVDVSVRNRLRTPSEEENCFSWETVETTQKVHLQNYIGSALTFSVIHQLLGDALPHMA